MKHLLDALRIGKDVMSLVQQVVRIPGGRPTWQHVRQAVADGVLRGDLDAVIQRAAGSVRLVNDYIDHG